MSRHYMAVLISCFTLTGCSYNVENIKGADRHVFIPEGEIAVRTLSSHRYHGKRRREETLSVGYSRASGAFKQTIRSNEKIRLSGTEINGPTKLDNEAEVSVAYLRFVRHLYKNERFKWYWGAGLGYHELDVTATDGREKADLKTGGTGPNGLVGLSYNFAPKVNIEANIGGYLFYIFDAVLHDTRVQLVFTPTDHLDIFTGYRHWYYHNNADGAESGLHFNYSGPTAGVKLRF